jgi:CBS domain-containing protein
MESILNMTAEQAAEAGKSLSFEKVWATLDRISKEADKRQEEADKRQKEADKRQEELDKSIKELVEERKKAEKRQEELNKQMKETDKKISKLGGRFGEAIECMVMPNLVGKFRELGLVFGKDYRDTSIRDEKNQILAEIDITLENGDKVMIVEVKSKPSTEDVDDHMKRMEKVRRHADLHGDRRKFLGAIAGVVVGDNERKYILKHGFYVIIPSGDTFDIIEPKGEYQPYEW